MNCAEAIAHADAAGTAAHGCESGVCRPTAATSRGARRCRIRGAIAADKQMAKVMPLFHTTTKRRVVRRALTTLSAGVDAV